MAEGDHLSTGGNSEDPHVQVPATPEYMGTTTLPSRTRPAGTVSQPSAVGAESDHGSFLMGNIRQPQPRTPTEGSGAIGRRSHEIDDDVDIASLANGLEDRIELVWQIHGVDRDDRRQVL
jgi:hypothetical protein